MYTEKEIRQLSDEDKVRLILSFYNTVEKQCYCMQANEKYIGELKHRNIIERMLRKYE